MRVTSFEWDDVNITHIANGCRVYKSRRGRYVAYGRSLEGRYLFIVFEYLGRGQIRVITAREMSEKEKKRFRRRLR